MGIKGVLGHCIGTKKRHALPVVTVIYRIKYYSMLVSKRVTHHARGVLTNIISFLILRDQSTLLP